MGRKYLVGSEITCKFNHQLEFLIKYVARYKLLKIELEKLLNEFLRRKNLHVTFKKERRFWDSPFEFLAAIFSTPSNWAPLEIQELL